MKYSLLSLFLLTAMVSLQAANGKIDNGLLEVVCENDTISVKHGEKSVLREFSLPNGIETARVISAADSKWGKGRTLQLSQKNGWITNFTLYKGNPFVHVNTTVINKDSADYVTNYWSAGAFEVDFGVAADKLRVIGTGHNKVFGGNNGSYAYMAIAEPESRNGVVMGWLTHDRGVGTFHNSNNSGKVKVEAKLAFGNYLVKAGKSRGTDTFVIGYFEDARLGLENWADDIAKQESIKIKPKPGVYCTWYHRNITGSGASNEKMLAENADFSNENLKPFGLDVMQIDDHWQASATKDSPHAGKKFRKIGPIKCFAEVNKNFPGGMKKTADKLAASGFVPGIWFMPFAGNHFNPWFDSEVFAKNADGTPFFDRRWSGTSIDSTNPKGAAFIRERVKRIYDWGYRYFKIDGLHTGMPTTNIYVNNGYRHEGPFGKGILYDKSKTYVEGFRKALNILHEEAPDVFVLGCTVTQNMCSFGPAFGQVDAMRVGPDNDSALRGNWGAVVEGARYCSNVYFLNGRVWHNDPDPYYVRKSNPLEKVRWMASWLAVSGSMNTTSEQYGTLDPARLDIVKRSLPVHSSETRPVDFLETNEPAIWLAEDKRMKLVGLFNWSDREARTISSSFEKMGLKPDKKYAAFEYWTNQFIGVFSDEISRELPKCGSEVIALREVKSYPQLLSTSRNINQGMTDVIGEKWNAKTRTLMGKSLVVKGDEYEMRFTVPKGRKIKRVTVDGQKVADIKHEKLGYRVTFTPAKTGTVIWKVQF